MMGRRQHTIPQFYLRSFLSPGLVYRLGATQPYVTFSPKNVAFQLDYCGRNQAAWETLDKLNSIAESEGASAFRKLVENPKSIVWDDFVKLSYLFANFAVRSPYIIEEERAADTYPSDNNIPKRSTPSSL